MGDKRYGCDNPQKELETSQEFGYNMKKHLREISFYYLIIITFVNYILH